MAHDIKNFYDYDNLPVHRLVNFRKHEALKQAEYKQLSREDREERENWDKVHERIQLDAHVPINWFEFTSSINIAHWLDYFVTGATFGGFISIFAHGLPHIHKMRKARRGDTGGLHMSVLELHKRRAIKNSLRMILNFGAFQFVFEVFSGFLDDYNIPDFWTSLVAGALSGGILSMKRTNMAATFKRGAIVGGAFIGVIESLVGSSISCPPYTKPFEKLAEFKFNPAIVRVPPVPYVEPNNELKETVSIWNNNIQLGKTGGSTQYAHDNRLWHWPDLNIVGIEAGEETYGIPTNEKATYNLINTSRAYEIGQLDWDSENRSTGRFANIFQGKDMYGNVGTVIDDLEMQVQDVIDNDVTFTDPTLIDLAECLVDVGEDIAKAEAQGKKVLIEKTNDITPIRYNSIYDRWNRYADELIHAHTVASRTYSQLWNGLKSIVERMLPPEKQPLYMVEPNSDLSQKHKFDIQKMRNLAMSGKLNEIVDRKHTAPRTSQWSSGFIFPTMKVFWEVHNGKVMPPGLPLGLPKCYYSGLHD
ncbi:uncharacterized protein LOC126329093 [Schistocerca gregaria]|uniref:uncharacterized protein LOC126329093 n=1 Tax=Schistocerca gregaria TaxID=7010 RepID=UPI00211ED581|nr:uncharacterized protein LOC126329093 [Schistocerca gregaria]